MTWIRPLLFALLAGTLLVGCASRSDATDGPDDASPDTPTATADTVDPARTDTAEFAGGCFWCMEPPFDRINGVVATISGFSGGDEVDPSYEAVAYGRTGHTETVRVIYDTTKTDYPTLLDAYWRNVDPLDGDGQFCDRGKQYRPAIFVRTDRQRRLATASKERVADRFDAPIEVAITPFLAFYRAEDYHQNFYQTHSAHYKKYRKGCGRDARLEELWGESRS